MATEKSYRVLLNQDWELEDLYEFPHALLQCYTFIYCLDSELQPRDRERINYALREYPWRGGYSYVNIYTVFKHQVPISDRPRIKSIQKSSPGWIDLLLNVDVAHKVAAAVTTLSGAAVAAVAAYKKCYSLILNLNAERRSEQAQRLVKSAAEMKAVNAMCVELAKHLGFKSLKELHEHTGDPEISMKLLLAHYRRMSVMVEYSKEGKATLTLPDPKDK
jgi:hypothetical protein